jgi:hypothetical protein
MQCRSAEIRGCRGPARLSAAPGLAVSFGTDGGSALMTDKRGADRRAQPVRGADRDARPRLGPRDTDHPGRLPLFGERRTLGGQRHRIAGVVRGGRYYAGKDLDRIKDGIATGRSVK